MIIRIYDRDMNFLGQIENVLVLRQEKVPVKLRFLY